MAVISRYQDTPAPECHTSNTGLKNALDQRTHHAAQRRRQKQGSRSGHTMCTGLGMLWLLSATHVWHVSDILADSTTDPVMRNGSIEHTAAFTAGSEPLSATSTEPQSDPVTKVTYVVNEGGSLWRTGKRFINDEAVLNTLIDKMAAKGMNVRRVHEGMAFIVEDLGSAGLLVVFNDGKDTYISHIFEGSVATLMKPQAGTELNQAPRVSFVEP